MFTLDQIKKAHARVKSGADFPHYIQVLKKLGVTYYDNYVSDGRTFYFGLDNFKITGDPKYPALNVTEISSKRKLERDLKAHQDGHTDYATFCKQAAEAGVEKWTMHLVHMTCTYYDKKGTAMLMEEIPEP